MDLPVNLAPVVIFCYNRPWHLRQTVEALQLNTLAPESTLIVYSDGPKQHADEPLIQEIRKYLAEIKGFKNVTIINSETNNGLAVSIIKGVSEILRLHKKIIVLEDDMLSTPDFLTFMNEALETYKPRTDIFSVTAYSPPFEIPSDYKNDLYLAPRASSWGWGTWREKWEKADWEVLDFKKLQKDKAFIKKFGLGGADLWPMLVKQQLGVINSWAIRWTYCQFQNNAFGVYPVRSKIRNIGTDGSGTNFTFKTGYYGKNMDPGKLFIDPNLKPDDEIIRSFGAYYRLSFYLKIKNWIKFRIPLN